MYRVSAQGVDERMINVHYYYYYYSLPLVLHVSDSQLLKLIIYGVSFSLVTAGHVRSRKTLAHLEFMVS